MKLIFDTNSIINIIQKEPDNAISIFRDRFISVLSFFELGNVIWKLLYRKLINQNEGFKLCDTFASLWSSFKIISPEITQFKEIVQLAIQQNITFYDAAFIHYAKINHLTLVTDDGQMNKIAKQFVPVRSSENILSQENNEKL